MLSVEVDCEVSLRWVPVWCHVDNSEVPRVGDVVWLLVDAVNGSDRVRVALLEGLRRCRCWCLWLSTWCWYRIVGVWMVGVFGVVFAFVLNRRMCGP